MQDRYTLLVTTIALIVIALLFMLNTQRILYREIRAQGQAIRADSITSRNAPEFRRLHDRTYNELRAFRAHIDSVFGGGNWRVRK